MPTDEEEEVKLFLVSQGFSNQALCIAFSLPDVVPQPRFYCILSPEASEDDLNRLDSTVSKTSCFLHLVSLELGLRSVPGEGWSNMQRAWLVLAFLSPFH